MTGIVQSGYYKLTRRFFVDVLKRNLMLCGALFIVTILLLIGSVGENSYVYPYESLIKQAGIQNVFLGALALLTLITAYQMYTENYKTGGVYTLMMLPMPRRHVYLAYCTVGVVSVLMVWTVQVLALFAAYLPVMAKCRYFADRYEQIQQIVLPFSLMRSNGLFLAVVRGELFHVLLPQSWQEGLSSLIAMLALGFVPAYGIFLSGARRAALLFLPIGIVDALWALGCRFDIFTNGVSVTEFVTSMSIAALVLVAAVWDGIRRMNRDANLIGW